MPFSSKHAERWLEEYCTVDGTPSKYIAAFVLPDGRNVAVTRDRDTADLWIEPCEIEVDGVEVIRSYGAHDPRNSNLNQSRGRRLMKGQAALFVRVRDAAALENLLFKHQSASPRARVFESYQDLIKALVLPRQHLNFLGGNDSTPDPQAIGYFKHMDHVWTVRRDHQVMPLLRALSYPGDPFAIIQTGSAPPSLRLRAEFADQNEPPVDLELKP
jgi:hypothetical protein